MKLIVAFLLIFFFYLLQKIFMQKNWNKRLTVTVNFIEPHITEGDKTMLVETIENNKRLSLPMVHIKFATTKYFWFQKENNATVTDQFYRHDMYTLGSYERIIRKYPFICSKRGTYTISNIDVLSKDLFLTSTFTMQTKSDALIYVKPRILPEHKLPLQLLNAVKTMILHTRTMEDPFEFKGIREYQPYDNIRYINWKSTAKTTNLQVNTHYPTTSQEVDIVLNMDTFRLSSEHIMKEYLIRIAFTIADMLNRQGISFQVITNAVDYLTNEPVCVPAGHGDAYMTRLGISFARIDTKKQGPEIKPTLSNLAQDTTNRHQLIFISNSRKPELVQLFDQVKSKTSQSIFLVPEFNNIYEEESMEVPNLYAWGVDYSETI